MISEMMSEKLLHCVKVIDTMAFFNYTMEKGRHYVVERGVRLEIEVWE